MKIKFLRTLTLAIVCLAVFLATTFIPSFRSYKMSDFLQGFSIGMGLVALIATIYYYLELKKQARASGSV